MSALLSARISGLKYRLHLQLEIEKVQKRREERELEKARAEEEAAMLNRERAVAEGFELDKKEELVRSCPSPFVAEHCCAPAC